MVTVQQLPLPEQDAQISLPLACAQCGATADLASTWERVYSHTYRWVTRCRLRPACWARADARQGVA